MNPLFERGIELILTWQQAGGSFGFTIAQLLTIVGNQEFYLLLFPLLFWCLDRHTGARLAIVYLLSIFFNTGLKDLINQPRPYELEPLLAPPDLDAVYGGGHGMPSGHAQWSMTVWTMLAVWVRRPWFWAVAIGMSVLIGLSRIYLGVHFPLQVAGGWALGLLVLALYLLLHKTVERWLAGLSLWQQLVFAIGIPAVLLVVHPVSDVMAATAVLAGVGSGLAIAEKYVPYRVDGSWPLRLARYAVGIVILLFIYLGLSLLFPSEGAALYVPLRIVRYILVGLWISLGAPWLFTRTHLAKLRLQPA